MILKSVAVITILFFFDCTLFGAQHAVIRARPCLHIITVDGLSGCGKSTVCQKLAQEYALPYLYTGFLYRGLAWALYNSGYNEQNFSEIPFLVVEEYMKDISYFYNQKTGPNIFYKGFNITNFLKNKKIDLMAPLLGNNQEIRFAILDREYEFVQNGGGAVVDSRDAGWLAFSLEFFPNDCVYRFFLTASRYERACRWKKDQEKKDIFYTFDQAYDHIAKRDTLETSLTYFRIDKAADALEIDTTHLSPNVVFHLIVGRINKH